MSSVAERHGSRVRKMRATHPDHHDVSSFRTSEHAVPTRLLRENFISLLVD